MEKIIKLNHVNKNNILKNINLEISEGQCVSIMGNSGAGKSTLLNIMAGLDKAESGTTIINNIDITNLKDNKLTKFRAKNISYIFQDYKLIEYLNVAENIQLIEKLNKNKIKKDKYENLLNKLRLKDKTKNKISTLSGGEKQRVAIARSLIGESKIIFADEPTGALDVVNRDIVLKLLIDNARYYHKTLVIITHDPTVAIQSDKIFFVNHGEIIKSIKTNDTTIKEIESDLKGFYHDVK